MPKTKAFQLFEHHNVLRLLPQKVGEIVNTSHCSWRNLKSSLLCSHTKFDQYRRQCGNHQQIIRKALMQYRLYALKTQSLVATNNPTTTYNVLATEILTNQFSHCIPVSKVAVYRSDFHLNEQIVVP